MIRTANEETVLILQLESKEAYDNIDAIVEVGGFDVLLVGPMDLSASVGFITETGCEEVQRIMEDVPKRIAGSGIVAGTTLGEVAEIQEKYRWGYRFLNVGSPLAYGMEILQNNLNTLRSDPTGEGTAHQIINTSNGLLRYLALSSLDDPEICYYPDSDKYGSYAGDANTPHALEFMAEKSSAIDYWKDE